jgi:hypothetical protein
VCTPNVPLFGVHEVNYWCAFTKHLDIKIKNLRDKFKKKEINVQLITSEAMLADSLTKAAPLSSVKKLQDKCLSALSTSNKEGC